MFSLKAVNLKKPGVTDCYLPLNVSKYIPEQSTRAAVPCQKVTVTGELCVPWWQISILWLHMYGCTLALMLVQNYLQALVLILASLLMDHECKKIVFCYLWLIYVMIIFSIQVPFYFIWLFKCSASPPYPTVLLLSAGLPGRIRAMLCVSYVQSQSLWSVPAKKEGEEE